jgi:O-methyltransferase involved in polyketide biosynthesis
MYLTEDAIAATLRQVAGLAPGSTLAMEFILPLEFADPEERPGIEAAAKGARASGTPFISFFTPPEMLALAREAGFREVRLVSAADLIQRLLLLAGQMAFGRSTACFEQCADNRLASADTYGPQCPALRSLATARRRWSFGLRANP